LAKGERKGSDRAGKGQVIKRSQKWNCALGAFFALAANTPALAQVETQRAEIAEAVRVDRGPKLDATLDDPLWR
jgi:hypothetical protein